MATPKKRAPTAPSERQHLALLDLSESAAYSAKNHFKSADVMRFARYGIEVAGFLSLFAIALPWVTNFPHGMQVFAVVSTIASVMGYHRLSPDKEQKYMSVGDQYLRVHKDALELYGSSRSDAEKVAGTVELRARYDRVKGRPIGYFARKWSKRSLEHRDPIDDELDMSFLRQEKRRLTDG